MNPAPTQMDSCLQLAGLKGLPAAAEGFNFVFSPLSLRAALSLTAAAARGETLQQLLSFLASPNIDHLHSASSRLVQAIHDRGGDGELLLSFVNGLWIDRSVTPNPSFLELAASTYAAAAESVDFINQSEIIEKKINNWIEEKTSKMIKNIIPDGTLDNSTRLVLANALYFKGKWEEQFEHSMTKVNDFYLLDGSRVQVPFMSSIKRQFISSSDTFTVLKLPYKQQQGGHLINKSNFSMLFFLPNERNGLHDLITRVASEPNFVDKHVPNERIGVSRFMIPKFKFSFDFEASDALKSLGLRHIFKFGDSDLSGMCLEGGRELFVSKVYHKVAVEVDEEGTTAAAATVLVAMFGSRYSPAPPVNFVADHPFLFVVREDATGAILFLGHVVNPLID